MVRVHRAFLLVPSVAALAAICSGPAQTASRSPSQSSTPSQATVEYVDTWGNHGEGPGQLNAPVAIAGDGETNIYIADAGSGYIHKFSTSGEPRLSFQDDRLNLHPTDIAVDAGAAIYVADAGRRTVVIYFSDGMHHRELRGGALAGARESVHVGVDAYGTIFVTAKQPFGVRKFNTSLRPAGSWGGRRAREASVENPSALVVGQDGLVYINDVGRSQITVFDAKGTVQRTLSVPADVGAAELDGIAVTPKYALAVETKRPTVHVWALDGTYRLSADLSPWIPAGSATPRKLVITPAGELLVLDITASRVFRFRLHL
jgi:streptogramin lyase